VSKFGGILFTSIQYFAKLEGQGIFVEPEWTPSTS